MTVSTDLLFFTSCIVPFLTEFSATPDVRNNQNGAISLEEREDGRTEEWVYGDAETSVTYIHRDGILPVSVSVFHGIRV